MYDHNIKITSSETLLLKNSPEVRFVHDFITVLGQPNNQNLIIKLLSFIADQQNVLDKHLFFSTYFKDNIEDISSAVDFLFFHPEVIVQSFFKIRAFYTSWKVATVIKNAENLNIKKVAFVIRNKGS